MTEKKYLIMDIEPMAAGDLLSIAQDLKTDGYRLGQACATATAAGDELEVLYTFEKDNYLKNFKIMIDAKAPELQSLSAVYPYVFIYENEMHDLFGIEFKNLVMDYHGKYIVIAEPTPWNPALKEGGEH